MATSRFRVAVLRFAVSLVQSFDQAGKQIKTPIDGRKIAWDMKAGANKTYGGGKVWSPEANKTYTGKLSIKGNQLTVKGCVLAICRTGAFGPVSVAKASTARS